MRKLHKIFAEPSRELSPERVHDLRTRCYRVESAMGALGLADKQRGGDLVKALEAIRKSAGKVRDADVFTGLAATIGEKGGSQSLIQLVEELGVRRDRYAGKLERAVDRERKKAREELQHFRKRIEKQLEASDSSDAAVWGRNAVTRSIELTEEIAEWPKLEGDSLHPFRLKVKELRVVLQLSPEPEQGLINALRDVKDAIGEWHDWSELGALVAKVFGDKDRSELSKRIRSIIEDRLHHALALAARLREGYFGNAEAGHRGHEKHLVKIKEPVLRAAAKMAA